MAGKTTNLQLQKIDNTDYVGNFPTIYNNNLDLIDVLYNKQDKLTAGANITISSNNVISAKSGAPKWKVLQTATPTTLRGIYEMSNSAITVKKTFRIKVCFGTINYEGGVHATLEPINKGVYAIDLSIKKVCCVGAGATMVKEGDINNTLLIGWWLSKYKDNNTGSSLELGYGSSVIAYLINRDYQISSTYAIYDVNVDSCEPSYNNGGLGPYTFCIEYLDE